MNGRQKLSLPPPRPAEERSKARELYLAGNSYQEINQETNIPVSTLRNWCKRDGWKLAKSQPNEFEIVPSDAEEVEVPESLAEKQEFYETHMSEAAVRLAAHVSKLDGEGIVKISDKLLKADTTARKALKLTEKQPFQIIQIGVLAQSPAKRDRLDHLPSLVRPQKATTE